MSSSRDFKRPRRRRLLGELLYLNSDLENATSPSKTPPLTSNNLTTVPPKNATQSLYDSLQGSEYYESSHAFQTLDRSGSPLEAPVSLMFVLLLVAIWIRQWNRRATQAHCLGSYMEIVQRRRYYRVWIAVLTHVGSGGVTRRSNNDGTTTGSTIKIYGLRP